MEKKVLIEKDKSKFDTMEFVETIVITKIEKEDKDNADKQLQEDA